MTFRWLLVLAAVASATISAQTPQVPVPKPQATPARDVVRESPATAVIRGTVIAAATGQPLHRVRITLNGTMANPPTAVTDARGTFELTDVPAGTFTITAARAGYLSVQYGQRRAREAGRTVKVDSGQVIEGIDIALPRGAVVAGRLTDELGEAMSNARVEAIELRYIRGRRVAVPARVTWTNDIGEYRLSGLQPGAYQVRASTRDVWEADDGLTTYTYAITYFPGVTAAERLTSITLTTGQQMQSADFHLVPGRAARVTGVVQNANGEPQAGQVVHLSEITRTVGGALFSSGPGGDAKTDATGAFEISKLPPGEYLAITGGPKDSVTATVIVQPGDSKHVVLMTRPPAAAGGSIVTDDGTAPPFPPARITVWPIATDPESALPLWGGPREQTPKADWTFRIPNTDGQYLFRVTGLPDEWFLQRVTLGSTDVTDTPVTVRRGAADLEGLQLVLSRKGGRIAGDVVDRAGAKAPDTTVIVFAENRALWGGGSRFIRAVRPDSNGRFSVGALPPGIYRAIACDVVVDGQWEDPDFLQTLVKQATRVELAEGASETVKLIQESVR